MLVWGGREGVTAKTMALAVQWTASRCGGATVRSLERDGGGGRVRAV
jgi:hypothetical protein